MVLFGTWQPFYLWCYLVCFTGIRESETLKGVLNRIRLFYRFQEKQKQKAYSADQYQQPEGQKITTADVKKISGNDGTDGPAGSPEKDHETEKGAMGKGSEKFCHNGRDDREKAAVGKTVDTGKDIEFPEVVCGLQP